MNDIYELSKPLLQDYLTGLGRNTNKQFRCINPLHEDRNASMTYYDDTKKVYCHTKGCTFNEKPKDIADVLEIVEGLDKKQVRTRLKSMLNISDDVNYSKIKPVKTAQKKSEQVKADATLPKYTDFYLQAHSNISMTDYLMNRGISQEVIDKYKIGYVEDWKDPRPNKKAFMKKAIILPVTETSYIVRNADSSNDFRYSNVNTLQSINFNYLLEETKEPIFIVEGYFDMLAIETVGYKAISLNSANNDKKLIEFINKNDIKNKLVLYLDNDNAGKTATQDIVKALQSKDYHNYVIAREIDLDANDFLKYSKVEFTKFLRDESQKMTEKEEQEIQAYKEKSNGMNLLVNFIDDMHNGNNAPPISTGFEKLDYILDGGLYDGLYFLGAISSLGKTAFLLQVADQIAKNGNDVIFMSLEMSKYELISRSLSRNTAIINYKKACNTRELTNPNKQKLLSDERQAVIQEAYSKYAEYVGNLYIHEGIGNIDTEYIEKQVKDHIRLTGRKPVLIIDYLQLIAPKSDRLSERQAIDYNVTALKRLSRDYKIPVVAISSFNRENYEKKLSMTAFKESGAIEYSSDVLLGLQFKDMTDEKSTDKENSIHNRKVVNEGKKSNPRNIELVVLKNRNGMTNQTVDYTYYSNYHLFKEGKNKQSYTQTKKSENGIIEI